MELKKWKLACAKGDHNLVFPNGAGNPESHANLLHRGFRPALRRARLRQIKFHQFRHSYVSLLIGAGIYNIKHIQTLLGHASAKVIETCGVCHGQFAKNRFPAFTAD